MLFCACAAQQIIIMLNEHFIAIFTAMHLLFLPSRALISTSFREYTLSPAPEGFEITSS